MKQLQPDNLEALQRAIAVAGGQANLGRQVGVTQQHVYNWTRRSKQGVPAHYVLRVEAATGISRYELRPDVYPPPVGYVMRRTKLAR